MLASGYWYLVTGLLMEKVKSVRYRVSRIRKLECGFRPIGAYAPEGRRKIETGVRLQPSLKLAMARQFY